MARRSRSGLRARKGSLPLRSPHMLLMTAEYPGRCPSRTGRVSNPYSARMRPEGGTLTPMSHSIGHHAWRPVILLSVLATLVVGLGAPSQAALGAGVSVNGGTSATVTQGDVVTMTWSAIDATSATGWTNVDGTPVPFPNWDGPKAVGVNQTQQLVVDLAPGTYFVVLEASDGSPDVARSSIALTVLAAEVEDPEVPEVPTTPTTPTGPTGAVPPAQVSGGGAPAAVGPGAVTTAPGAAVPRFAPRAGTP